MRRGKPWSVPYCLQALVYQYDAVGNITGLRNTVAVPPASNFGGPVKQSFGYDDLYRLTQAEGSYRVSPSTVRDYRLEMAYDSIHNITSKQQAERVTEPGGNAVTQKKTSYAWTYDYAQSGPASVRPHAPIHIGERASHYDANGNQLGWDNDNNGTRRTITWDEENRIQSVKDNGQEQAYWYDDSGERVIKRGPQGETVYVNQWYTIRDRSVATKHVFVGATRIASRLVGGSASGGTPSGGNYITLAVPGHGVLNRSTTANLHARNTEQNPHFAAAFAAASQALPTRDNFLFYYHPDHLGSTSHVTDAEGKLYEHIEYFPFGESWVEEKSNTQRTPYLFTGKELDEETGLYYFGARYYDARTGVWQSVDPILPKLLASNRISPPKLSVYAYGRQNPIIMLDPDGRDDIYYDNKGNEISRNATSVIWNDPSTWRDNRYIQGDSGSFWRTDEDIEAFTTKEGPLTGVVDSGVEANMSSWVAAQAKASDKDLYARDKIGAFQLALENSPQNRDWDYKRSLDAQKMYVLDGKAYFYDYVGNVAWAAVMEHVGFPEFVSVKAAGLYQTKQDVANGQIAEAMRKIITNTKSNDDPRDTQAIQQGYRWHK